MAKTSITLDQDVYEASKARARRLGITFSELVEMALARDLKERMAILRSDAGVVYAPIVESAVSSLGLDHPATGVVHPPHMGEPEVKRDGGRTAPKTPGAGPRK